MPTHRPPILEGYTHFAREAKSLRNGHSYLMFTKETCPVCKDTLFTQGIMVYNTTDSVLKDMGLVGMRDEDHCRVDDIYYSETLDGPACLACCMEASRTKEPKERPDAG